MLLRHVPADHEVSVRRRRSRYHDRPGNDITRLLLLIIILSSPVNGVLYRLSGSVRVHFDRPIIIIIIIIVEFTIIAIGVDNNNNNTLVGATRFVKY